MTIPLIIILLLIPLIIWEAIWKGIGMWKAARNGQLGWFIAILIINSIGILPIAYLYFFQKKQETSDKKPVAEKEIEAAQKQTAKKAPKKAIKKKNNANNPETIKKRYDGRNHKNNR